MLEYNARTTYYDCNKENLYGFIPLNTSLFNRIIKKVDNDIAHTSRVSYQVWEVLLICTSSNFIYIENKKMHKKSGNKVWLDD